MQNTPSDQGIPKEVRQTISQAILYRILGMIFGCLYVVGVYLISHSVYVTLILFIAVALPLHFGGLFYVLRRVKRSRMMKEEIPIRLFLYQATWQGFTHYTLPALFVVYVFLHA